MIPQSFIEEIQQRIDIVEIISEYIPLKRAGRNFKACCPFHEEKTPSFFVSPQKQIFHCFGCGQGGGVIQFLMLQDRLSFPEAVEVLAKRLGLNIPYKQEDGKQKHRLKLYEIVAEALTYYREKLFSLPDNSFVWNYLKKRGINRDIAKLFSLGYAPADDSIINIFRQKGFSLALLEEASLIVSRDRQDYKPLFINRIIFPIFDLRQRVVGFGGRTLSQKDNVPKYINSLENSIYHKRYNLFGLNLAKESIIKNKRAIVTEGYFDMITPFAAGITNIVASLGTALTIEQVRLLKRFTRNITLVFDSDKAGENASLRALDILLEEGMYINVVSIPKGKDIDEILRKKGKEYVENLLKNASDFFEYKLNLLMQRYDIEKIEEKVSLINEMIESISRIPDAIEKAEYIRRLSDKLKVREDVIFNKIKFGLDKNPRQISKSFFEPEKVSLSEKVILKYMCLYPSVREIVGQYINANHFSTSLTQDLFSFLQNEKSLSGTSLINQIEEKKMRSFISSLLIEDEGQLDKELLKHSILKLRSRQIDAIKKELRRQIQSAEKKQDYERVKELMVEFYKLNSEVANG